MTSGHGHQSSPISGHSVVVTGDALTFSAAHMATMGDDLEPLHGHSYGVTVAVHGPLTDDAWVWDFGDLRRFAAEVVGKLDHRFLLQTKSASFASTNSGGSWTLTHGDRRYVFPEADVAALPIDNSTAERLAEWISNELTARLESQSPELASLSIGVAEGPAQTAWYTVNT